MNKLISSIDRLCEPSASLFQNESERAFQLRKNRGLLIVHASLIPVSLLVALYKYGYLPRDRISTLTYCLCTVILLLLTCRNHLKIFKTLYCLIATVYVNLLSFTHLNGVVMSLFFSSILPVYLLYVTESRKFAICSAMFQVLLIKYKHSFSLMEMLDDFTNHRELHGRVIEATLFGIALNLACVSFVFGSLKSSLAQVKKAQEEKSEKMKQFLLGFSHELRNLVNSMIGNIQIAIGETDPKELKNCLENSKLSGEILLHLINNILDSGKAEVNELEINMSNIKIYRTIKKIWNISSEILKKKQLGGSLIISKRIPRTLKIDHYRLTQIILNLIINSAKFTGKGTVEMKVDWVPNWNAVTDECFEPRPFGEDEAIYEKEKACSHLNEDIEILGINTKHYKTIDIGIEGDSLRGVLKISVTDTGKGIKAADLENLFKRFENLSENISKNKLGTGLGLFITKILCKKMGGDIRGYSHEDKGSSFVVCLPAEVVIEPRGSSFLASSPTGTFKDLGVSALIVDDVNFNITVLQNYLRKLYVNADAVAYDGEQAVETYKRLCSMGKQPKIVTMDIYMPKMDAKPAANKIRTYEQAKGLQPCILIMISGNCADSEIKECVDKCGEIQADGFLKKPVSMEDFTRLIKQLYFNSISFPSTKSYLDD